jgi:hypothetical protein
MSELRASHDHLSVENHMLQARLQNFHALEGILFKSSKFENVDTFSVLL